MFKSSLKFNFSAIQSLFRILRRPSTNGNGDKGAKKDGGDDGDGGGGDEGEIYNLVE